MCRRFRGHKGSGPSGGMSSYGCPRCPRPLRRGTDGRPKRCDNCGRAPLTNIYGCVPCDIDICDRCLRQLTGDAISDTPEQRPSSCTTCGGAGRVRVQRGFMLSLTACPQCRGSGTCRTSRDSSGEMGAGLPIDDLFSLLTGQRGVRTPRRAAPAQARQPPRRSARIVRTPRSRDEFYELVSSSKGVVVDVTADWCPPSRAMAPIVQVRIMNRHSHLRSSSSPCVAALQCTHKRVSCERICCSSRTTHISSHRDVRRLSQRRHRASPS